MPVSHQLVFMSSVFPLYLNSKGLMQVQRYRVCVSYGHPHSKVAIATKITHDATMASKFRPLDRENLRIHYSPFIFSWTILRIFLDW